MNPCYLLGRSGFCSFTSSGGSGRLAPGILLLVVLAIAKPATALNIGSPASAVIALVSKSTAITTTINTAKATCP